MPSTAAKPALQLDRAELLFSSAQKRSLVLCLLLALLTLALYNSVSRHPFLNFDDDRYITENQHVRAGLTWPSVAWAFTSFEESNWHPLTWISHELDYQIFKLNPAGHHYTNLLLQCLNVILLFLLLQAATGFTWRSLMVAALFALHPVNVESVAWVAERKNVLSMLFFLLTLMAYGRYVRKHGAGRYVLVVFLFALGLMAKPMIITLPFVLLLWDYWPLGRLANGEKRFPTKLAPRSFAWLLAEKIPLFALSAASAAITMRAQGKGGAIRSAYFPVAERLANATVSYGRYVWNAFWPARLAPFYPHPADSIVAWQIGLATIFLLATTALVLAAKRRRYLAVGWFWFLGTLVPMIGLVQVGGQAMADRYAYLPYIGLFIMVCWVLPDSLPRTHAGWRALAVAASLALLALAAATVRQVGYWGDNVTLWTHTVQVTGPNFIAEDNLGLALRTDGQLEQAMAHFGRAVKINPEDPVGNLNVAAYEQQHGNLQSAMRRCEVALRMTPSPDLQATAYSNLGSAYRKLHDAARARENYQAALERMPQSAPAWVGLGLVEQDTGNLARAVDDYSHAMSLQQTDLGYLLLAQALEKAGRSDEAKAAYSNAQALSADLAQAQQRVNQLLAP